MFSAKHLAGLSGLLLLLGGQAQADSLRYEKVFTQINGADNRLILDIAEDGRVTLQRPLFMTHAGRHEWQLSAAELDQLWQQLQPQALAALDATLIKRNLSQRQAQELMAVTDSDVSRIEWRDGRSADARVIEGAGVSGWHLALPDQEQLGRLVAAEQRIWQVIHGLLDEEVAL